MCWSLHLETYRKIPSSFFFINLATCPMTQKCTVQQTLAVAISATFFSKYSVLSLSLSSSSAIPNIVSWHHLDKLHFYALSYVWQSSNLYPRTLDEMWWKPHELQRISSASKEFSSEIPRLHDFLTSEGVDYLKRRMV